MGYLSGIFVAEDEDVLKVMGQEVYLDEVLGKHSNVTAEISGETIEVLTDDQGFIEKFRQWDCSSGTDPIATYLKNQ